MGKRVTIDDISYKLGAMHSDIKEINKRLDKQNGSFVNLLKSHETLKGEVSSHITTHKAYYYAIIAIGAIVSFFVTVGIPLIKAFMGG